jgi:HK97 family phage portal protein
MPPPVHLTRKRKVSARVAVKEMPFYPKDEVLTGGLLPRATMHYGVDVRDGLSSNVILSPIRYLMRTFVEARAVVQTRRATGTWGNVADHPLEELVENPNEFYDGDALWQATIISYVLDGNGYWIKIRNAYGDVIQLWYAPHWMMTPKRDYANPDVFISHYDYTPGGETIRLAPRDVVHFRFGLDPNDTRKGLGCLKPLLREIFTDEEAAEFSASILINSGVPGLVISPAGNDRLTTNQVEQFQSSVNKATTGGNRGGTLALGWPAKVDQYGFDPNKLMLANLRDIAEERVCAMIGIPAAVVGFGSGMQSTKVGATMRELRQSAWTECLVPMQTSKGKKLTASLLPDFQSQRKQFRVRFDMSEVSAFQEEKDALAARTERLVLCGVVRRDRAQAMVGVEVDPTCANYIIPSGVQLVDKSGKPIMMPQTSQNGNGTKPDEDDEIPPAVAARRNGNAGSDSSEE